MFMFKILDYTLTLWPLYTKGEYNEIAGYLLQMLMKLLVQTQTGLVCNKQMHQLMPEI